MLAFGALVAQTATSSPARSMTLLALRELALRFPACTAEEALESLCRPLKGMRSLDDLRFTLGHQRK